MSSASPSNLSFVDGFDAAGAALPGAELEWLKTLRQSGIERFQDQGLPSGKIESWKYTRLRPLEDTKFQPVTDADGMAVRGMGKVKSYAQVSGYSQSNAGGGNNGWQAHASGIQKKNSGGSTAVGGTISVSARAKYNQNGFVKGNVAGTAGAAYSHAF